MFNRTARRANTRADVLASFPPRLTRRPAYCDSTEVGQLEFPFSSSPHLVRKVERFQNDRYLLAVHPPLNIENLLVKSKATFRIHCDQQRRYAKRIKSTSEITANTIPMTSK